MKKTLLFYPLFLLFSASLGQLAHPIAKKTGEVAAKEYVRITTPKDRIIEVHSRPIYFKTKHLSLTRFETYTLLVAVPLLLILTYFTYDKFQ